MNKNGELGGITPTLIFSCYLVMGCIKILVEGMGRLEFLG